MSGHWFARPVGWDLGRVSHSARVAGAHLAVTLINGGDVSAGLVLGGLTRRPVEFVVAPSGGYRSDWFNIIVGGPLEP